MLTPARRGSGISGFPFKDIPLAPSHCLLGSGALPPGDTLTGIQSPLRRPQKTQVQAGERPVQTQYLPSNGLV